MKMVDESNVRVVFPPEVDLVEAPIKLSQFPDFTDIEFPDKGQILDSIPEATRRAANAMRVITL